MKIQDIEIKDGYLLVVKTGDETHNMTVVSSCHEGDETLGCTTPGKHWWPVKYFGELGIFDDSKVIAIYGRTLNKHLLDNSTEDRELLWEHKEPKKMTVAEISAALGYDVEIVK